MLAGYTPWPAAEAERYRREGYWQGITLWDMMRRSAGRWPDRCALVFEDRRYSYAEVVALSERLARRLAALGLAPGQRVVLQLHNVPEFVFAFFALIRVGAIPVMALRPHRHHEISHFIGHSGAVGYVIPDRLKDFDYRAMAAEIGRDSSTLRQVLVAGEAGPGQVSLTALLAGEGDEAELPVIASSDVALMLLSGGTTALPKLIPRSHDDYVLNCRDSGAVAGFGEDTVYLAVLPLGHNYSLASPGILGCWYYGGRVVLASGTEAETVFPLIEAERVSVVAAAVPLVTTWLNSAVPGHHDLSSLQVVQNGGARLAPELRRRVRQQWGCIPQEIYGTAEGLLNMTRLDDPDELLLESSGAPVCAADEIKVVDEFGRELPDGQPGELLARGPYTVRGYFAAPETNAKAFDPDGFYHMGDVVRKSGRYLFTEGRKKDLVNRGGEKISTEEVENLILAHPAVEGACVVAMPDPVFGEKACAFVVLKPRQRLSLEDLAAFLLAQRIAKFKLPERLEVLDAFPVSPAGKILRRELRDMIARKVATDGRAAAPA